MCQRCRNWLFTALWIWMLLAIGPSIAFGQLLPERINLKALFSVVGRMHNLDPALLESIADVESGGDPASVSPKGAMGLMQLMPGTAADFAVRDPFDPVSNVLGAADFLDYLRTRIATSLHIEQLPDLLAAYNAGPKAVEKYGGVPPFPETHQYVKRVLSRYGSKVAARRPEAPLIVRAAEPRGRAVIVMDDDVEGSALDQLSAIRRARGHYVARLQRDGRVERRGLLSSRRRPR